MQNNCPQCGNSLNHSGECNYCLLQLGVSNYSAQAADNSLGGASLPGMDELNAQFPQLAISRLVGRGGMGAIYHARQTALDRDVALKLIAKEVAKDSLFLERFVREAKTLAKLSHPNIVTIYDFGHTPDGTAYLIMEYVDGINLREAISTGSVGAHDALDIVTTICQAVDYAHSKGVVHRDIKPENILLGEDGTLKVADFGIAKIIDASVRTPTLTATRQVLGSVHYLAPEHLEAPDQVDHRVDLYALGVVFYELLTGQLPLGRFEAPSVLNKEVDPRVDDIVLKALSRKPRHRHQSASELSVDLRTLRELPGPPPLVPPVQRAAVAKVLAVPFTCDTMGGFAEAVGVMHVKDSDLVVEYRIRDAIWGNVKSKTRVVTIPASRLQRLELAVGFFSSGKITIVADTISALGSLPNAETGRVELKVKKEDIAHGCDLVAALGFAAPSWSSAERASALRLESQYNEERSKQTVLAVLLLVCGIINAGSLAVIQVLAAEEARGVEHIAIAVVAATLIGPVVLIQLATGLLNFVARPRRLNLAAAILSMIPIAPCWPISLPLGIWAYQWLRFSPTIQPVTQQNKPARRRWGATTMMFIRESRWSKTVAVANVLGLLVLSTALAIYQFGWYQRRLQFRVASTDITATEQLYQLEEMVRARLTFQGISPRVVVKQVGNAAQLEVGDWSRHAGIIKEALVVPGKIELVWLLPEKDVVIAQDQSIRWLPIARGVSTQALWTSKSGITTSVATNSESLKLTAGMVSQIGDRNATITLDFTSAGREALTAGLGGTEEAAIGLMVGGLIEGVAAADAISSKRVSIRMSPESSFSSGGIIAAIRGPQLPYDLELLSN